MYYYYVKLLPPSLLDEASAEVWGQYTQGMHRHWTCPGCGVSMVVSVLERLQHQAACSGDGGEGNGLINQILHKFKRIFIISSEMELELRFLSVS